jgi:hypothetical protein
MQPQLVLLLDLVPQLLGQTQQPPPPGSEQQQQQQQAAVRVC